MKITWVPARCFWTITADRNACDILLHNIYSEGYFCADSILIGKNCESNDSDPHDGVPLNTEMIGESTTPSVTNIQCILNKLEEVITAKHYRSFVSLSKHMRRNDKKSRKHCSCQEAKKSCSLC